MTEEIENKENSPKKWTNSFRPKHVDEPKADDTDDSKLASENADLRDKLLRTLAELENTRRRADEEREKTIKFAITNFTKDLITVMENFYLAFNDIENKNVNEKNNSFQVFFQGIELTFNEFKKVFERNNVKRIFPLGEVFDPDFHEAIAQVEDKDNESGVILEVMQAGYTLNGRVLKPALVVVAK
jgi:molecular chaperone GrpE